MDKLFKTEAEVMEEAKRIEAENREKVRAMLRAKVNGKAEGLAPATLSYEDAQGKGDVRGMLYHKLGIGKQVERQQRLNEALEKPIGEVMSGLKDVSAKIDKMQAELDTAVAEYQYAMERDFKNKTRGLSAYSSSYMLLQGEYLKGIENIGSIEPISMLKAKLQEAKDYKKTLMQAKDKYTTVNADMIERAIYEKRMAEIQNSGLLDDID